jgi:branched-chain amino acid transport system substrate-binding protein
MSQTQGILLAFLLVICVGTEPVAAEKKYDPGASDNEIKVGNIMPYSGPLSAYALIGRTEAAFFNKINAEGGINGRKINFITYDDAFSPPKTVEQARKLVESDEVLLIFQSLGTPTNNAIRPYMNQKKVPQLFVATGATHFGDWMSFPWTMGWQPTYQTEGHIYAKYILQNLPQGKIGILLPERRFGSRLRQGPQRRPWSRRRKAHDRCRSPLRSLAADCRFSGRYAQNLGRRHFLQRELSEIRCTGDQESG